MIDLYVIKPEDKQGIQIDFENNKVADVLGEVAELCSKNHVDISSMIVENSFGNQYEKSIHLVYMNGSKIQLELKHGHIVFYDEEQLHACYETDLEQLFGLTTNYRKANREYI